MPILAEHLIEHLIQIEKSIHYNEFPPPERKPFVVIARESPIIFSAPHGAITFRFNNKEVWHEEDEYTAGMALLISELCNTSVIATIWRTEESDPNEHPLNRSSYKQELCQLVKQTKARWLIDLHGAGAKSNFLSDEQLVDLGIGIQLDYLPHGVSQQLVTCIEQYLGKGATDRKGMRGFPASDPNRIAAFAHTYLSVSSVQVEMKPAVRVARRRVDATMYGKPLIEGGGPYAAPANQVLGMMQALVNFIEYLKSTEE